MQIQIGLLLGKVAYLHGGCTNFTWGEDRIFQGAFADHPGVRDGF